MDRHAGAIWKALAFLGFLSWQWLVHVSASEGVVGPLLLVLLTLPLLVLAWWAIARAQNKAGWFAVLLVAVALLYGLAKAGDGRLVVAACGVPHALINLLLLWLFARTLLPGSEALVTRLARRIHGELPPVMEVYTRRLTVFWCMFFAAQVVISIVLFTFGTIEAWSFFINVLNLPLVALMFVLEYCYKVVRYRNYPHASIATIWKAFVSDSSIFPAARAQ